jgi:hypothetical protein
VGDFAKLRALAMDFRPDEVIVAAPGEGWPVEVKAGIERLTGELLASDIRVLPMLMRWACD